jgi:hypothetical protein
VSGHVETRGNCLLCGAPLRAIRESLIMTTTRTTEGMMVTISALMPFCKDFACVARIARDPHGTHGNERGTLGALRVVLDMKVLAGVTTAL